jgi:hypothetical protein
MDKHKYPFAIKLLAIIRTSAFRQEHPVQPRPLPIVNQQHNLVLRKFNEDFAVGKDNPGRHGDCDLGRAGDLRGAPVFSDEFMYIDIGLRNYKEPSYGNRYFHYLSGKNCS